MAERHEQLSELISRHTSEALKFDYFVVTVSLAICAYLAQTNPYGKLGLNKETFMLVSLLIFAASVVCSFIRIERLLMAISSNISALKSKSTLGYDTHVAHTVSWGRKAKFYYRARNILLALGLACYLATKVWATYQSNGWISVT
jgi:hypothetical protein